MKRWEAQVALFLLVIIYMNVMPRAEYFYEVIIPIIMAAGFLIRAAEFVWRGE